VARIIVDVNVKHRSDARRRASKPRRGRQVARMTEVEPSELDRARAAAALRRMGLVPKKGTR
jgi:hypothetical protein